MWVARQADYHGQIQTARWCTEHRRTHPCGHMSDPLRSLVDYEDFVEGDDPRTVQEVEHAHLAFRVRRCNWRDSPFGREVAEERITMDYRWRASYCVVGLLEILRGT